MDALLLSVFHVILGLSDGSAIPTSSSLPVGRASEVSQAAGKWRQVSDSKGIGSLIPTTRLKSLRLHRGSSGEAFVTAGESSSQAQPAEYQSDDLAKVTAPSRDGAARRLAQGPGKSPSTLNPPATTRIAAPENLPQIPNLSAPATPISTPDLLPLETGTGTGSLRPPIDGAKPKTSDDSLQPDNLNTNTPGDTTAPAPIQLNAPAHIHGDEFPSDIDNISPAATTEDQVPDVSATIRFDEKGAPDSPYKGYVTIFDALDTALVKSPRAAALRSLLPVTQSELARATEQAGPDYTYDFGVKAEQTRRTGVVFNWEPPWKLVFRLLVARRLIEQTKQDLLTQLWSLRAEVRLAYAEVVVAQETLETLNSLYDLAHRLMVVSEKRFQAGDVPELDLLKARLAESQYDVERRVGLRRVIRAKQQLNIIMGRPAETPLTVPRLPAFLKTAEMNNAISARNLLLPDFGQQTPTLQYYIDIANNHRYELKSIDRQIALNKAQMRNAIGNIFPSPQYWTGSSVTGNPPTGPKLSSYYFGVNVPTNITSFQQGDIAKYKATGRQLQYQTKSLKNVISSEVSGAYNNVLAARQKLRIYQEHVLADSYEVARLARRSYEVGQSDITSTIQAQQNNVQIRTQYLEAIQLYQQAFTELERACGTPLLESDE